MSSSSVAGCAVCTAKSLSLAKLKRLNSICFACLCLLGLGTVTLSTFFLLKYRSLKRRVVELEERINEMSEQLEGGGGGRSNSPRPSILSLISSSSSSDLFTAEKLSSSSRKPPRQGILKKSVSFGSDLDTNSRYETPPSSPIAFEQFERRSSDDNKSLELLHNQDYESLKLLVDEKQRKYEEDPGVLNNSIDYLKTVYCLSEKESDVNVKRELELRAYELAKSAVEAHPDAYLSRKWLALTIAKVIEHMGINEKAKNAFELKKQLDKAIDLNSNDYILYYMRGRWSFKIYSLNWAERYAAKLVFGNIPDDCLEAAFVDFSTVELLNKNKSKGNMLYMAKCLIEKKRISEAKEYLRNALVLPAKSKEHALNNEEIQQLLAKY